MLVGVRGRPETAQSAERTSAGFRRLGWPLALAIGAVALFLCALREARAVMANADGAAFVLQAHAMLHGNLLLHGWYVADVSYYTTELPEYMLVELARGMSPDVVHICAALTYTLLVVLAAFTARGAARGRTGIAAAAITVAIMLGPSIWGATLLLTNPDHTGTAVPVLVVFALIDRAGRRWYVPVAAGLVLAVALVGDPLVLLIGVLPVLVVFGARACQVVFSRGMPASAAWYEVSLAAAALLAVGAASVAAHLIRALGGFVSQPGANSFVPSSAMGANVWGVFENFLGLFSADFFGQRFGRGLVFTAIHLVAAALVALALWLALRRFFRGGGDPVDSLLALAICADAGGYCLVYRVSTGTIREMAPVFALGAALAGRMLAGPLLRNRLEPLLAAGTAAALLALAPAVLPGPAPGPYAASLASWLRSHHLREGIAGYWQANSVTLDSAGQVTMRPVREYRQGGLAPYPWELDKPLLDSRVYDVNFLITTSPGSQGGATVTVREGAARFGEPYRTYRYEQYVIMVWRDNLLPEFSSR